MLNENLEKAFNEQINAEIFSEYLYLSMKAYLRQLNLMGFVNWMDVQVQEERAHAMGMFDYVHDRGGKVDLHAIGKPKTTWNSVLEVFEDVLKHEESITLRINKLMDVAEAEGDRAAVSFLDWYLKEQVEEESSARNTLATLNLIKDDAKALLLFDKDLATRTFTAPVIG